MNIFVLVSISLIVGNTTLKIMHTSIQEPWILVTTAISVCKLEASRFIKKSHPKCSIRKAVFKKFAIFTGKHLCWFQHRCFPVNIEKFLRKAISQNNSGRLLLSRSCFSLDQFSQLLYRTASLNISRKLTRKFLC